MFDSIFQDVSDQVSAAVKVGVAATGQVAKIGAQAVSAAPKIIEEHVGFVQGLGQTVEEHRGVVTQVILGLEKIGKK
jgi:hypothetical protein